MADRDPGARRLSARPLERAEDAERRAVRALVDFRGKDVLEVGCGDGRMTWMYADEAASVVGIDPIKRDIRRATAGTPRKLRRRVTFRADDITTMELPTRAFDVALFSHSL